jgi:protein TonB
VEVQQQDLGTTVQAGTPNPVEDDQVQDVDFASFDDMSKALSTKGDIDISNLNLDNINLDAARGDLNVGAVEKEANDDDFIQVEKEVSFDYAELQKLVDYPELAKKAGIQGTVVIKVYINNQGKPTKTQVLASDNKMLNEAATKAITSYTGYKPAIQNKQPVGMWMSIPIKFRLN